MTGSLFLDWAMMAVSLFNTVLLLWLGLTVLLNADQRSWAIWLGSAGLLLGSAFFVSHTALLGRGMVWLSWTSMIFWWTVGLIPAISLPYAWYLVVLWYAGFWEKVATPPNNEPGLGEAAVNKEKTPQSATVFSRQSPLAPNGQGLSLQQRQRPFLLLTSALLLAGLGALLAGVAILLIPADSFIYLRQLIRWSIAGVPLLALGYSFYLILCIALSIDALLRPGPSMRVMGSQARQRARPWLVANSILLLFISLLVVGFLVWAVQTGRSRTFTDIYLQTAVTIARFDLLIASLIAIHSLILGQAIVSYEVFTGKTLPRRGLLRHWRRAALLALGYSIIIGGSLAINLRALYSLLLATMLMTFFFALFSWRSYAERENYIASLRPFITSQRLYEQLLTSSSTNEIGAIDIATPFRALCADVFAARLGYLAALGPLAPLVGPPLSYGRLPDSFAFLNELVSTLTEPENEPQRMQAEENKESSRSWRPLRLNQNAIPLDPEQYGGAIWAIPLWSQRGLIGLFLLGEKRDGGLYSQEEIDIARVSGERLIDTQASTEMARRLMALQRERLAQTQIIDQRTRRTLHDDILPTIHTAMIALSTDAAAEALPILTDAHRQISDLLRDMPTISAPEVARLGLATALQRTVVQEFSHAFDDIIWEIEAAVRERESSIPTLTAEVIFYAAREAVRNAARYGRQAHQEQPFVLTITADWHDGLWVTIEDNGRGLQIEPQNSKGSGQGLALHTTMMAVVGGELQLSSQTNQFTRVTLHLPEQ